MARNKRLKVLALQTPFQATPDLQIGVSWSAGFKEHADLYLEQILENTNRFKQLDIISKESNIKGFVERYLSHLFENKDNLNYNFIFNEIITKINLFNIENNDGYVLELKTNGSTSPNNYKVEVKQLGKSFLISFKNFQNYDD